MSFGESTVDLHLDAASAAKELERFLKDASKQSFPVQADVKTVAPAVENAVKSAKTTTVVTADATQVTKSVNAAIPPDPEVRVYADASIAARQVEEAIPNEQQVMVGADASAAAAAVDNAIPTSQTVGIEADASTVTSSIENAVDGADKTVGLQVDASGSAEAVQSEMDKVANVGQSTSDRLVAAFAPTPGKIAALLGGTVLAAGVQYNALVQRTTAAFETLLGSAEAASAKVQEIIGFAQTSPFPRQVFLQATQMLISFGVEADRVVEVLGAVQDAVAATGGSAPMIMEITEVLAEIKSTGDISAETLNMLGMRGVNAAKLIGDQMGMTEQAIRESITDGTLDANAAFDALVAGMESSFGGAAENVKATFDGAVDRVKAAVRDLGSAIAEPFVSKEGGGAAVQFLNDLADALRSLERQVVPVATQISKNLAPVLESIGQDLLPALVDAFVAMTPALGQTSTLIATLVPIIQAFSAIINAIPDPVLAVAGAFLLLNRAAALLPISLGFGAMLAPLAAGLRTVAAATTMNVASMGALRGAAVSVGPAISTMGASFGAALGAISPFTAALVALTIGWGLYSQKQQKAAEDRRESEAAARRIAQALDDEGGAVKGVQKDLEDLIDTNAEFTSDVKGTDLETYRQVFQETGATVRGFTQAIEAGSPALYEYAEALEEAGAKEEDVRVLINYGRAVQVQSRLAIEAGISTDRWTEAQVNSVYQMQRTQEGGINTVKALELLEKQNADTAAAEEEAAQEATEEAEAFAALVALAPQLGRELESVTAGTRAAEIGMLGLADQLVRTGASAEAIAFAAGQLGLDANEFGRFVEVVGGHMATLRNEIGQGLPELDDVFGLATEDLTEAQWAEKVLEELNKVNEELANFAPNVDALAPWPHLRERAAREGPEVAAQYAQLVEDGNTALLDQTESGLARYGLELAGLSGWIDYHTPGFVSTMNAAALLGVDTFNMGIAGMSVSPGFENVERSLQGGSIVARDHASEAGRGAATGFNTGFTPDAATAMGQIPGQITGAGVPTAAGQVGTEATTQFGLNFNPQLNTTMQGLLNQLSSYVPSVNLVSGGMGQGAAVAFQDAFAPQIGIPMGGLLNQLSSYIPSVNLVAGGMGLGGAVAFQDNFKPDGSVAMTNLVTGIANYSGFLNEQMVLMAVLSAQQFSDNFAPSPQAAMLALLVGVTEAMQALTGYMVAGGLSASSAFSDNFKPNPSPALMLMLAAAQASMVSLGLYMGIGATTATSTFASMFKPDPLPALSYVLNTAKSFIEPVAAAGREAGARYARDMMWELQVGANGVSGIVGDYARRLAAGLNPILAAIGQPPIQLAAGGIVNFARGGMTGRNERHVAQIAPAGAMRVWAEPETGGEAYIPLAQSKRSRSRSIATETVRQLGGAVQWFGQGGVTGDVIGLDPRFLQRLAMWAGAVGQTYNVDSGYRDINEQRVVYARYLAGKGAKAAVPGSSMHNYGLASDGPHWGGRNPGAFGLRYPMSFEPWHVEPNEARAWAGQGGFRGAGLFTELPQPPDIEQTGALADVAEAVMKYVYSKATEWTMTAFDSISGQVGTVAPMGGDARSIGQTMAAARGWTGANWVALNNLWTKESGWSVSADNPSSSAFGIPQALPGSKMASHGADWRTNPATQIAWGLDYIAGRYGNPLAAWAHSQRFNWYSKGGLLNAMQRPKLFDNGGTLDRGWNVVRNATGAPERLVRAEGGATVTFAEGSVQVSISAPVRPGEAKVIGRQIGRGIDETLAGRNVRVDARLAGS